MNAPVSVNGMLGVPAEFDEAKARAEIRTEIGAAFSKLMGAHDGAQATALLGGWGQYLGDPDQAWTWDAETMAARASELVRNDPHARAMLEAAILGVFGPTGLHSRSLYQADDASDTTDAERAMRRKIDASIERASSRKRLDAAGQRTRRQLGIQFFTSKVVTGDGFAVRCWKPNRPNAYQAQAWRIVRFERVCNPQDKPNTDTLWEGLEFDEEGSWTAIHIRDRARFDQLKTGEKPTWTRIPVYAEDGQLNVLHGFRSVAGERRGFSWFAPLLVLAKHLQQTVSAYVIAKRIQACHPTFVKTDDPDATAAAAAAHAKLGPNTEYKPGRTYYTGLNSEIVFPQWSFNGADFLQFVDSQLRVFTATWGMPFQFVLQQLTETNLAASRAALDQASRAFETMQGEHIEEFDGPIDESIIREDVARGRLAVVGDDWDRICKARWLGPRQWSTDRVKDADAAGLWKKMGKSPTKIFAEQGMDFEEEIAQSAQDERYVAAQKVILGDAPQPNPAPPAPPVDAGDQPSQDGGANNEDPPAEEEVMP